MSNPQDSYVQVAADGVGKKIDNAVLTREPTTQGGTGDTVYRQRVVLGDDENPNLQAKLTGEAGDGELAVNDKTAGQIVVLLTEIRDILRMTLGA